MADKKLFGFWLSFRGLCTVLVILITHLRALKRMQKDVANKKFEGNFILENVRKGYGVTFD
jgi:hypothetical protein